LRLETERLLLRLPEPKDAEGYAAVWSDPEVVRFLNGELWTVEDAARAIARMRRHWEWFGLGPFTVVRRQDERLLGRVGLLLWDPVRWVNGLREQLSRETEIEIGWTLGREFWNHGYGTEAALAVRDWALAELGASRLISLIAHGNAASVRVAEKIGARLEREDVGGPFRRRVDLYSLDVQLHGAHNSREP
jgi:RimJ/RimL family protein N-acetyltransferase